jgi:DNA-binding CsgD family transcriptional regulator
MSKSGRPRLKDVRQVYRLLGECAEAGADSSAWRSRLLAGMSGIIGARVGLYMHVHRPLQEDEGLDAEMAYGFLDADQIALWGHYRAERAQRDDLFHQRYFQNHHRRLRTRSLDGVVRAGEWKGSRHYNDYVRACDLDDRITTSLRLSSDAEAPLQTLVFHRDAADREFAASARYLVNLMHHELAGMLDRQLAMPTSVRDTGSLAPRLAQVLEGLLDGQSEKQIAFGLGLSPHTVNRHVQRIYRHFGVNSRGRLIALLIGDRRQKP